jgi:biotin carboxyl carrier protein
MAYIVQIDDIEFRVDVQNEKGGFIAVLNDRKKRVDLVRTTSDSYTMIIDNIPYAISIHRGGEIVVNGEVYTTQVFDEQIQKLIKMSPDTFAKKELTMKAPMPGLVVEVLVAQGDTVKKGQGLLVVEAMKMQNDLKASRDGVVKQLFVVKGQTVNSGDRLIIIE